MFGQAANQNHYPVFGWWRHWTALMAGWFRRSWQKKTTRSNRLKFRLVFSLERVWSPISGFLFRPRGSQSGCGNDAKNLFKHGQKSTRVQRLTRSCFQITRWKPASDWTQNARSTAPGGHSTNFIWEGYRPRVQPLALSYSICDRQGTLTLFTYLQTKSLRK